MCIGKPISQWTIQYFKDLIALNETRGAFMSLDIKNKIVFITGASSGMGKATASEFAKQCLATKNNVFY